jgi:hypothetical protein
MVGGVELEEGDDCHLDGDAVANVRVVLECAPGLRRVVWQQ